MSGDAATGPMSGLLDSGRPWPHVPGRDVDHPSLERPGGAQDKGGGSHRRHGHHDDDALHPAPGYAARRDSG